MAVIRSFHRYISIAVAAIWFVQAVTGTVLVFQRELDTVAYPAPNGVANFAKIEDTLSSFLRERPGSYIPFVYTHNDSFNRFEVYVMDKAGAYNVLLMEADGRIIREIGSNPEVFDAGFFEMLLTLHTKLWAGDTGYVITGLGGILLLTNLLLGLKLAWPKRKGWRRALSFPRKRNGKDGTYNIHRMLGLYYVVPTFFIILSGTLILYEDGIANYLDAHEIKPVVAAMDHFTGTEIGLAEAMRIARAQYPDAGVSLFTIARPEQPYYRIRLLQEGETRRLYGKTIFYISAVDGTILDQSDGLNVPPKLAFMQSFYTVHTGEMLGFTGRLMVLLSGVWLAAMLIYGLRLWWLRR